MDMLRKFMQYNLKLQNNYWAGLEERLFSQQHLKDKRHNFRNIVLKSLYFSYFFTSRFAMEEQSGGGW